MEKLEIYWGKPSEIFDGYLVVTSKYSDCSNFVVAEVYFAALRQCMSLLPKLLNIWTGSGTKFWDFEGRSPNNLASYQMQSLV